MKGKLYWFLVVVLLVVSIPISASAATHGKREYTEKELDRILTRAGYPYLHELNYEDKKFIVQNSGVNLKYNGRTETQYKLNSDGTLERVVPAPAGQFQTMGTINTNDLTLWFEDYTVFVNGVKHRDVYPRFQWKRGTIAINDSFGVAIPEGWSIISSENSCQTQSTTIYNYGTPYETWNVETSCGGRPAVENIYGKTWSSFVKPGNGTAGTIVYKGTAYFRVKKVNSNAINRFVGSYVHDTTSSYSSSYGVTLGYGAISFSLTGNSSSSNNIDTAGFSKDIIW